MMIEIQGANFEKNQVNWLFIDVGDKVDVSQAMTIYINKNLPD